VNLKEDESIEKKQLMADLFAKETEQLKGFKEIMT
jgi:hypothetical protein